MKKILVCEDEQVIREFVVINLKRAGYEAYEAENGEQALEIYEREGGDFDVAVLDIMMPGKYDGLAVCKELRKRSGTIGIILLTANTGDGQSQWFNDGRGRLYDKTIQSVRIGSTCRCYLP